MASPCPHGIAQPPWHRPDATLPPCRRLYCMACIATMQAPDDHVLCHHAGAFVERSMLCIIMEYADGAMGHSVEGTAMVMPWATGRRRTRRRRRRTRAQPWEEEN